VGPPFVSLTSIPFTLFYDGYEIEERGKGGGTYRMLKDALLCVVRGVSGAGLVPCQSGDVVFFAEEIVGGEHGILEGGGGGVGCACWGGSGGFGDGGDDGIRVGGEEEQREGGWEGEEMHCGGWVVVRGEMERVGI
jgi:hypothetical protein